MHEKASKQASKQKAGYGSHEMKRKENKGGRSHA
jgi:hypothetical protein